jgi:alginate O-acetyltransferase complex protein AlgI
MLFPTVDYVIFFLVIFTIAWTLRRPLWLHKVLLLGASYVFYGYWDWRFVPLLAGISLFAAVIALLLQRTDQARIRKLLIGFGVAACLVTLGFFKYRGFAMVQLAQGLARLGVAWSPRVPEVALPVGISFFVFHAISLMVDAYRRTLPVKVKIIDALLYVAFFPQLVAGPILRASQFMPQLARPRDPGDIDATRALELIVLGLVKKVLVANFLATHLVDAVFDAPAGRSGLQMLLGVYGYAAQIYGDFSGYTDIAIGSALLLGYKFPENFDRPYISASPQEFWRRWHLSLSGWLRDYLYISLGGSRGSPWRTSLNLFLTMVLGGLWHGAAWTFVAWGALHGGALVLHRLWSGVGALERLRESTAWLWMARLLTFHFVCAGWILFRAPTFSGAVAVARGIFSPWHVGPWLSPALLLALAAGIVAQYLPEATTDRVRGAFARLPLPVQGAAFSLCVLLIETFGPSGIAPFIYFQF